MIPPISAKTWNNTIQNLSHKYPIQIQAKQTNEPTHTWKIDAKYDKIKKSWFGTMSPGSVNAKFPTVTNPLNEAPQEFYDWYKKNHSINPGLQNAPVEVPLIYKPKIKFYWREIGGDAIPVSATAGGSGIRQVFEQVPLYFKKLGVRSGGSSGPYTNGMRRLFACDIVLRQPREYLKNNVSVSPGGGLGGSIVSIDASGAAPKNRIPKIVAMAKYAAPQNSTSFSDIFFQKFQDEQTDELHLSTVYALSQEQSAGSGLPDGVDESFSVMTRYYCHYNLAHATRTIPRQETNPLRLETGLAAGLGDTMFNYILANQQNYAQGVLDMFQQRSLRGMFWII